jgi:hypothetical protein
MELLGEEENPKQVFQDSSKRLLAIRDDLHGFSNVYNISRIRICFMEKKKCSNKCV